MGWSYVQTVIRSDLVSLSPNSMMLDIWIALRCSTSGADRGAGQCQEARPHPYGSRTN